MAALATASFAQVCACPSGVATVYAEEPPPPLPVQEQPPMPAPGYLWTPGYWHWNNVDYYWVPGAWVEPPRPGVLWTPGYWGYSNGVYAFNPGYWGPRVGFYGGVAYASATAAQAISAADGTMAPSSTIRTSIILAAIPS
jgi:hypothetical protein